MEAQQYRASLTAAPDSVRVEQSSFTKSLQHNSILYHCRTGHPGRNLTAMKGWWVGVGVGAQADSSVNAVT